MENLENRSLTVMFFFHFEVTHEPLEPNQLARPIRDPSGISHFLHWLVDEFSLC